MNATNQKNWFKKAPGELPRYEVHLSDIAYSPHRHESYTIALTLQGVQSFQYRGKKNASLPGQVIVLHPDEIHDGQAGTEAGFTYRSFHINPELIQAACGLSTLPFLSEGVYQDPALVNACKTVILDLDRELSDLEYYETIQQLSDEFIRLSRDQKRKKKLKNANAIQLAKDYIQQHLNDDISMDDLEQHTQYDRWQLARDFRTITGTSPYRYLIYQRLNRASQDLLKGRKVAETALAFGFTDQSHFHRHFKQAFGLTPRQWFTINQAA